MFTGIIQEVGTFKKILKTNDKYQLTISGKKVLQNVNRGDSIAVNGVCLTVINYDSSSFTADVMPETLRVSNLGNLRKGSLVNLEQAIKPNGFFGGHLVSGHIDGMGTLKNIQTERNARIIQISSPPELTNFMVDKGSVALNGVSLTIVSVNEYSLTVSLIPETWENTNFYSLAAGDKINIETDLIAKYVAKLLKSGSYQGNNKSKIDRNFLQENGFL